MIRKLGFIVVFVLVVAPVFAEENSGIVFLYYYAWYGNPDYDGQWVHWDEEERRPPIDISSAYYPRLGPYSSSDPWIIDRHMRWISQTGTDVLIYSWWGKRDSTNELAQRVLDSAADYNLRVSFLIEPYPERTIRSICADIEYLTERYGNHPAFFRISRKTAYSSNSERRGVFFIYQPEYQDQELQRLSDQVHSGSHDSILLLQSTDADLIDKAHADGIFAYEAYQNVMHFYRGISESVRSKKGIFVPCVSPGFDINRGSEQKAIPFRGRKLGDTYDAWWKATLASNPDFVGIVSFNEWHEGTQIEPAIRTRQIQRRYVSYEKSYGKTGIPAEQSYLHRTERWIQIFHQLQP
jgi:Glycosyl hydrolase family 99